MKILMLYENIPDSTYIYILDNVSPDDWKWLQLAHGKYINEPGMEANTQAACDKLSIYLENKEKLAPSQISPLLLRDAGFDYFIHTGFIL